MKCSQCGINVEAWRPICAGCGAALSKTDAADPPAHVFRNPKTLTLWLQGLLIAGMVMTVVAMAVSLSAVATVRGIDTGAFPSTLEMMTAADAMRWRQQMVSYAAKSVGIATLVVFAMWIYRVCANVHALGAPGLTFGPGWSVGCYCVPLVNLWLPYLAMGDIMRASRNPANWVAEKAGPLVGWWWFLYLSSTVVNVITVKVAGSSNTTEAIMIAFAWIFGSQVIGLLSLIVALTLVRTIYKLQAQASERFLSLVFT